MKMSVIIPVYNGAKTIRRQLKALNSQDFSEPWEIIIADNGSTDETRSICRDVGIPNLRIVDASKHRGPGYARNIGVSIAQSENLAFCDADDEVAPGWLAGMSAALKDHNFIVGKLDWEKLNEPFIQATRPPHSLDQGAYYDLPYSIVPSGNFGIKKFLYESIGGFDISIPQGTACEDDDFTVRVRMAGERPYFAADVMVHYRYRTGLRDIFQQSLSQGRGNLLLRKRYKNNCFWMEPPDFLSPSKLVADLVKCRSYGDFGRWIWSIGKMLGRHGL